MKKILFALTFTLFGTAAFAQTTMQKSRERKMDEVKAKIEQKKQQENTTTAPTTDQAPASTPVPSSAKDKVQAKIEERQRDQATQPSTTTVETRTREDVRLERTNPRAERPVNRGAEVSAAAHERNAARKASRSEGKVARKKNKGNKNR